jgi:hypothetical protein
MYQFAIVALLGLALFKLVDLVEDLVPGLAKFHTFATIVLGVAAAVVIDYSLFRGFHVGLRRDWMGVWATGFIVAGTTSAWRAMFHWLGSNEGDAPELRHQHGPRSMAA